MSKKVVIESHFLRLCVLLVCLVLSRGARGEGSCIAAGYTSCCNSTKTGGPCAGNPPVCFCDPSCRKYDDCCPDLEQICRDPVLDEALNSLKPVITFPSSLTFHTAALHWFVLPSSSPVSVNGSYQILLTEDTSTNSTYYSQNSTYTPPAAPPSPLNFTVKINVSADNGAAMLKYQAGLYGLKEGTRYNANMLILTNIGSVDDAAVTNFSTIKFKYSGNIVLKVKSSSSVQVTWNPLSVPEGITVKHYKVTYSLQGGGQRVEQLYSPEDTQRTIHSLHSNTSYSLDLSAVIMEKDDSLYTISLMPPATSQLEFFVPGSSMVQLVTSGSVPNCSNWTVDFEILLKKLFHTSLLDFLNSESSDAPPLEAFQVLERQLTCEFVAIGNQTVSQATYRAEVFGTEHISSDSLVDSIQEWVKGGVVLISPRNGEKQNVGLRIELSTSCPVKIERASVPLCGTKHGQSESSLQTSQDSSVPSVSVDILAISLAAELVVLVVAFLSLSMLITQLKARRRKWLARKSGEDTSSGCSPDRKQSHTPSSVNNQGNSSYNSPGDQPDGSVKVLI